MLIEEKNADVIRCCGPEGCGKATSIASNDRYCIGTACAGWRWIPQILNGYSTTENSTGGYCGLAGKP